MCSASASCSVEAMARAAAGRPTGGRAYAWNPFALCCMGHPTHVLTKGVLPSILYPATCGPEGHGSGPVVAQTTAAVLLQISLSCPRPVLVAPPLLLLQITPQTKER